MRIFLRMIHLIGLGAFLGSVFVHILFSALFSPQTPLTYYVPILIAQHKITVVIIAGGLAALMASGVALTATGPFSPRKSPWLAVKLGLAALVVINAFVVLEPAGAALAEIATEAAKTNAPLGDAFLAVRQRETIFGAINMWLTIGAMYLGLSKRLPFGSRRAGTEAAKVGASAA